MTKNGVFIVLEGTDGSGKGTQFKLLAEHLKERGHDVALFDFPQYDQPSSHFVKKYLNGEYGTAEEIGPYTASLFYALDRFEAAAAIREALEQGKIVLANRFTGSNMAHQGTKFVHAEERRGYFIWLDNLEFEMLKVPRPDLSLVLRVPADVAQKLVDQKESRSYTDKKRDLHEADLSHLERSVVVYDDLCQLFPKDFQRIDCVRGGELLPIETVHELVRQKLEPMLPARPADKTKENTPVSASKVTKQDEVVAAVPAKAADELVTNATTNVYGFTDKLSPQTIAAGLAQFAQADGSLRTTILQQLSDAENRDKKLPSAALEHTKQLSGQHIVVEQASSMLAKKLEWGRLAAYVEQSSRAITYDKKDESGNYKYYIPDYLSIDIKTAYCAHMDEIFRLYGTMVTTLAKYLEESSQTPAADRDEAWSRAFQTKARETLRPVLPVAAETSVGVFASGQALESLVLRLLGDPLPEARGAGEAILAAARKANPTFFSGKDMAEQGNAWIAHRTSTREAVKNLANDLLSDNHAAEAEPVQLVSVWPRNEFDLVPDMLYEHSNLPLKKIQEEVATWSYEKRLTVFEAYIGERTSRRQKPGRALEKAHYSWDLVSDYDVFRDLQRHRMVDDLEWQELTPRYGFDMPKLVEEASLEEDFQTCFDISLKLHSLMQVSGYDLEAQYATLLGHKMRWKVTYNAREAFHLHELRLGVHGHEATRKLVRQMHEKLSEVHPLLGESMKFASSDHNN